MARSENVNIQPPLNVLAWCDDAEAACHYAIQNTSTGAWLKTALVIIRAQHSEIQAARNDLIDATASLKSAEGEYDRGFVDGLKAFAWWRDGVQYVGTSGSLLDTAIANRSELFGYDAGTKAMGIFDDLMKKREAKAGIKRRDATCPECGLDWSTTCLEPEYPLCSASCVRHMRESGRLIDMAAIRRAIEEWANEHGYQLLESETDALCVELQPLVNLLVLGKQTIALRNAAHDKL